MKTSLVVSGNDEVGLLVKTLIMKHFKIIAENIMSCDSVHEAREYFQGKDIDILVLDVDIDCGFMFLEEVKSAFTDTTCIVTSEDSKHVSRVLSTGSEFVARPFRGYHFECIAAKLGFLN